MVQYKGMDLYGNYLNIRYRPLVTFLHLRELSKFKTSIILLNLLITSLVVRSRHLGGAILSRLMLDKNSILLTSFKPWLDSRINLDINWVDELPYIHLSYSCCFALSKLG